MRSPDDARLSVPGEPETPHALSSAPAPASGAAGASPDGAHELRLDLSRKERHDLYTPLNQIIGYGELLLEESEERGQADAAATLKKINRAAKDLNRMLTEILGRATSR